MRRWGRKKAAPASGASREAGKRLSVRIFLAGFALFLAGLILGLVLAFPGEILENRLVREIESNTDLEIELAELAISPLLKLQGQDGTIHTPSPLLPELRIDTFELSPLWLSLFSANPGLQWQSGLLGGELQALLHRDGRMNVTAENLQLDLPVQEGSDIRVTGRIRQAQVSSSAPLRRTTESDVQLVVDNLRLGGVAGLQKDLVLGTLRLEATGQGTSFKITSLQAAEGDFVVEGRGSLLLGTNPASSRVNLRAEIRPTPTADPSLVELLNAFARQRPDGAHEVRLSGSLANPSLQ